MASLLLTPPAAQAQWTDAFPGESLDLHVGRADPVGIAGAGGKAAAAAAHALDATLRSSGRRTVVLEKRVAEAVGVQNDAAILRAFGRTRAARIAIVRVYPGPRGAAANAVVVVYSADGRPLSSFYSPERSKAGGTAKAIVDNPDEHFRRKALTLGKPFGTDPNVTPIDLSLYRPYRGIGENARRISWPELYRTANRPELAARYKRRTAIGAGVAIAGVLTGAAGLAMYQQTGEDGLTTTGILMGTSFVCTTAGFTLLSFRNPLQRPDAEELIDDYNRKLRKDLGIAAAAPPTKAITVGVSTRPGGGGLDVAIRF